MATHPLSRKSRVKLPWLATGRPSSPMSQRESGSRSIPVYTPRRRSRALRAPSYYLYIGHVRKR
jgi:hypothetical protein